MNIYDASLFTAPDCLPCCTPSPADCSCALLIPPFASPYADYATAETAITDFVSNCMGYIGDDPSGFTTLTFSAAWDGTTLSLDVDRAWTLPPSGGTDMWSSLSLDASAVITVTWTAGGDAGGTPFCSASLYSCDGTLIETVSNIVDSSPLVFSAVASAGEYYIKVNGGGEVSLFSGSSFCYADITCSSAFWVNPVIALWDDSGTTRRLWACPKLLLPPLTESTGDWYADCAAADASIDDYASNCVGFYTGGDTAATVGFTATDGGTSLTLSVSTSSYPLTAWGGVNAEVGETIIVTTTGGTDVVGNIYDDAGILVEAFSGTSPFTSAALPYTGRYSVEILSVSNPPPTPTTWPITATITSSGTLSVNPIQARYDLGLDCSGLLDCGDACP